MLANQHFCNNIYVGRCEKWRRYQVRLMYRLMQKIKKKATSILKEFSLNMSTFVNMAIKQLIKNDGIPFEVTNKKTKQRIIRSHKRRRRYFK